MCGIFGIAVRKNWSYRKKYLLNDINKLFILSESRGKEASGMSLVRDKKIMVYKESIIASELIKTIQYQKLIDQSLSIDQKGTFGFIGHSRLVTNGSQEYYHNNQPVITDNMVGVHNGIIVNSPQLWEKNKSLDRKYELDSEIIFRLIDDMIQKREQIDKAILKTFDEIYGQASIATFSALFDIMLLYTNNGSLYLATDQNNSIVIFASEKIIIERLIKPSYFKNIFGYLDIKKILPNSGYIIDLATLDFKKIDNKSKKFIDYTYCKKEVIEVKTHSYKKRNRSRSFLNNNKNIPRDFIENINNINESIKAIKRCKKCILPSTMPFIQFDELGICNFCTTYRSYKIKDINVLKNLIKLKVQKEKDPNCVMAISGGRDSCFGLHYAVKELGLKPVAYTYDWGLVSDLARRNTSRMVSSLGIEHILISADIHQKRNFVKRKVLSWLKRPKLGLIPLFQSGDKHYFYYMKKVLDDNKLDFVLYTENPLEKTNFKTGFAGIFEGDNNKSRVYNTSLFNKINLGLYFSKEFLLNPSYLNLSLADTFEGYISSFFIKHDWEFLFQYYRWNENEVNKVLVDNYDWETASDTTNTWRIGDSTAPFYNYIYYVVAGFTENDTFRSNQVREGIITRAEALEKVKVHNQPRWESIKLYCETIDIDFDDTIKAINKIKKLY